MTDPGSRPRGTRRVGIVEVQICEVGPRDGLQNEPGVVATEQKRELIDRLVVAGMPRIEVTSFVSPRWIPALADADALAEALPDAPGVRYAALVPNAQGWVRFRASGRLSDASLFISASETHNRKNVNRSVEDHLDRLGEVCALANADGVRVRACVATAFGCPEEGWVDPKRVIHLARRLFELGAQEIVLGDTIGVASPRQVREIVAALTKEIPADRLVLHLHDTYGRALANVIAGYEQGVRRFDSSLGGLGGCPYSPGASGNLASEDLVALFDAEGVETGVDLQALVDASDWLEREVLARTLPGRVLRAELGRRTR